MKFLNKKKLFTLALLICMAFLLGRFTTSDRAVDFSADVKPILNKKCISCHGGVRAKAGFSVLFRDEALAKTESGKPAIIPGDPDASELVRRINEKNPEERMPYKHEKLSDEEIGILTRWIKQGAKWGDHWAYLPVKETPVPAIKNEWIHNDVDRFILDKLDQQELKPSAPADKPTMLRRVSLDIIGTYPSAAIAEKYLDSDDPKAYESLVDSLIASPQFGERWATMWLDLARYADSKGYEADLGRKIWRYRDWVIRAFNEDKRYDEFLRDQIAGDMLPDPTDAQYIATAFSRNSMTNDEGGTDNEEYRTVAIIDRVNTTWEALMGTTFSCVQCHSHPYDPFKHDEYYKFMAYFNNTRDEDQYPAEYPYFRNYNEEQHDQINKICGWVKEHGNSEEADAMKLLLRTWQPAVYASTADSIKNGYVSGNNGSLYLHNNSHFRMKHIDLKNVDALIFNYRIFKSRGTLSAHLDSPDGAVIGKISLDTVSNMDIRQMNIKADNKVHDIYFTYQNNTVPAGFKHDLVNLEWMAFTKQFPGEGTPGYDINKKLFWSLLKKEVETVPVMVENPSSLKRQTHVFERGNRLTLGKAVEPQVPNSLSFAMPKNAPANRMGLVRWLIDKKNPLVSRTIVNRIWEQIFGTGIVETLEDMGTQGTLPTHKELLDHYSWKFMNDYQWSMKKLIKEFVMSAAYRQDSKMNDELKQKDAFNRYYARGPRVRLQAEQLRDQHLSISGVLSNKMYGPGIMPWQPKGIWSNPYNSEAWINSKGEDQYRRSVYTYLKRTGTYPSFVSFDATSRIVCTARRIRTNTPLQALATLNDSAYVDMAAHFANRMRKDAGNDPQKEIAHGYEIMLYKKITPEKLAVLKKLYDQALTTFSANDSTAKQFTGLKENKLSKQEAALKVVANAMLNLDEVITKN